MAIFLVDYFQVSSFIRINLVIFSEPLGHLCVSLSSQHIVSLFFSPTTCYAIVLFFLIKLALFLLKEMLAFHI